jgi:hypothetical protein
MASPELQLGFWPDAAVTQQACGGCGTATPAGGACPGCGERLGASGLVGWTPGPEGHGFDPITATATAGRCPGCGRTQCSGPSCPTRGSR